MTENKTNGVLPHIIYRFNDLSFGVECSMNREINNSQVRKIFKGIENGTWNRLGIIMVDLETREIVDGNHRYEALRRYYEKYGSFNGNLIDVVFYQRNQNESLSDAVKFFNNDRKAWTSHDYFVLAEKKGNDAINQIREFGMGHRLMAKTKTNKNDELVVVGFNERYVYSLLYGRNMADKVKDNTISCNDTILSNGDKLYNEIEKLVSDANLTIGSWFEQFIQAWHYVRTNLIDFQDENFTKIDFNEFSKEFSSSKNQNPLSTDKTKKHDWVTRFTNTLAIVRQD